MTKYKNILANPKYGAVSFISYFYFLLYELFSPYIEVFGVLTTLLAFAVDLINVPLLILFFGIYVVYTALLSLTAFFALYPHHRPEALPLGCAQGGGPVRGGGVLPAVCHGLGADDRPHRLPEEEAHGDISSVRKSRSNKMEVPIRCGWRN